MSETLTGLKRSHYCGVLRAENIGETITVCGWVQKQRDKGGLIFIDLRDRTGILQLTFDETTDRAVFEKAKSCRSEYVLAAVGTVRERSSKNPEIPTGDIEIAVTELRILNKAITPAFEITDNCKTAEDIRLKNRYMDLRRPALMKNILFKHQVMQAARRYFSDNGFIEIETPMMIKSTPEGARDYIIPSRVHNGSFYALPQSPQLYKQLLMVSGFDKYFQLARCFHDEDLRADRQPEFTQIDVEMSFVDADFLCASRRMASGCGGRFGNSGGGLAIFRSVRTAGHSQGQPAWNTSRFLSGFGGYSLLCGGNCADLFGGMVYFENQEA